MSGEICPRGMSRGQCPPIYRPMLISTGSNQQLRLCSLYLIISEIGLKRDIGRKSRFYSYTPAFDAPVRAGGPCRNLAIPFGTEKN